MMKTLRNALLSLAGALALAAGGAYLFLNPNQFKPVIRQAVADYTGLDVIIAGAVEFQLLPELLVVVNDVRLRHPAEFRELASARRLRLRADPYRLLRRELVVAEVVAERLHVNYLADAEGDSAWLDAARRMTAAGARQGPSAPVGGDGSVAPVAGIQRIVARNSSLRYEDRAAGTAVRVDNLEADVRGARLDGTGFPFTATFAYLADGMPVPAHVTLDGEMAVDVAAGRVQLEPLAVAVPPLQFAGAVEFAATDAAMAYSGSLRSNAFPLAGWLDTLGLGEAPGFLATLADAAAGELAYLDLDFRGDRRQWHVPRFSVALGGTDLGGELRWIHATELAPAMARFEVVAGAIDLDSLLAAKPATEPVEGGPASGESGSAAAAGVGGTSGASDGAAPPWPWLRNLNASGTATADALRLAGLPLADVQVLATLDGGQLDLGLQSFTLWDGTGRGSVQLDGSGPGALIANLSARDLDVGRMAAAYPLLSGFGGRLGLESAYEASGGTPAALLDSVAGTTSFAVADSVVDISLAKQVFTAITVLSPAGNAVMAWPDRVRVEDFSGYHILEGGWNATQSISLRLDNFELTGQGMVDLAGRTFDYQASFTLHGAPRTQTLPVAARYQGIAWPVRCSAGFAEPVRRFCSPDLQRARDIIGQLGRDEVLRQVDGFLEERVSDELQEAARSLLRRIFD